MRDNDRKRCIKKPKLIFKVFCEGDTEYNYFDHFKQDKRLSLALRPINLSGGGYAGFLNELRKDPDINCIAKFIVIDGDKIMDVGEKENFKKLLEYCQNKNNAGNTPYIIIVDTPDFEYIACLHSPLYKNGSTDSFICSQWKYKKVDDFKADRDIYEVLNKQHGNSYDTMLSKIKDSKMVITNTIKVELSKFQIKVSGPNYNSDNVGIRGSNITELFAILREFEAEKLM